MPSDVPLPAGFPAVGRAYVHTTTFQLALRRVAPGSVLTLRQTSFYRVQVDFLAYTYEQSMPNYKILQLSFDRIEIRRVCFFVMVSVPILNGPFTTFACPLRTELLTV